jgi:hypothetical protein
VANRQSKIADQIDRFVSEVEWFKEALKCAFDAYDGGLEATARLRMKQLAGNWGGTTDEDMRNQALAWATTTMGGQHLLIDAIGPQLAERLHAHGFDDAARRILQTRNYAGDPETKGGKLLSGWIATKELLQKAAMELRLPSTDRVSSERNAGRGRRNEESSYGNAIQKADSEVSALPDGVEGYGLRYKGKRYELTRQGARILKAVWARGYASGRRFMSDVWPDADGVEESTITSALSKLNRRLFEAGLPLSVHKQGDTYILRCRD